MPSKYNCFPECVIVNKKLANAESLNWRNDYHKYAGWSYADIVKGKNSGVLEVSASVNVAERSHCINHSEKSVNTLSNIKTRPASIHRQCSVHVNKSTERKICSIFNRKSKGKAVTTMSDGSYDKNTQKVGTSRNNDIKQVVHSQRENGVLCRVPCGVFSCNYSSP